MAVAKKAISLNEAPEHFFDQENWASLVTICKNRKNALHVLTYTTPRILGFGDPRPQYPEDNLTNEILSAFINKLSNREIIAKGIQPPSKELEPIPAAIWEHLSLNFNNNTARGGKYSP